MHLIKLYKTKAPASLLLLLLFCLSACNKTERNVATVQKYFDLNGYFETEIRRLSADTTRLKKTVAIDGSKETQNLLTKTVNWEKELAVFTASDLNKPAFFDAYRIDSIAKGDTNIITYTALRTNLRTQYLALHALKRQAIERVTVKNQVSNPLYTLQETLIYQPHLGYSITSKQKVGMLVETSFDIYTAFAPVPVGL